MRKPSDTSWLDSEVTRLPTSRYLKWSTTLPGVIAANESGFKRLASESTCDETTSVTCWILSAEPPSGVGMGTLDVIII